MARYREKDETDLVWNRVRRHLTRDLDTRIMNFREELLNRVLSDAWNKYAKAIESGTLIELEDAATSWVEEALRTQFAIPAETAHAQR